METVARSKVCTSCLVEKQLEDFYKDKKAWLGRTAQCRICILAKRKAYYQQNQAAKIAYSRKRYSSNRETERQRRKAYRERTREAKAIADKRYRELHRETYLEYLREYHKHYYRDNKHKRNAKEAKRRAAKRQATPTWANFVRIEEIYKECEIKSKEFDYAAFHVDHIEPLLNPLVCGLHVAENLQIISASENCIKQNHFTPYGVDVNGDRYELPIDKTELRLMVKMFKSQDNGQE